MSGQTYRHFLITILDKITYTNGVERILYFSYVGWGEGLPELVLLANVSK